MLTKTGVDKILKDIMETTGLTGDIASNIDIIRNEFADRDTVLAQFGDVPTDVETYEWQPNNAQNEWRDKYESEVKVSADYRNKYIDRFFGGQDYLIDGGATLTEPEPEKKITINDLFKQREV